MAGIIPKRGRAAAKRPAGPIRRGLRRLRRWLLLAAALAVFGSAALVVALRWLDPPTSAFMLARRLDDDRPAGIDYRWRPLEQLSPSLPLALVAAEDQRFPEHSGFDLGAIRDALGEDRGRLRGASTISQQVAKNLFLWSGHSWLRKGLEAWFTVLIEASWGKRRILEVYANIAEFGDGIYGAEAAAQQYFGTPAARLDAAQSARLAAVLPNPRRLSVAAPSRYVLRRQHWIEQQMRQLGGPAYLERCCRH